MWEKLRFGEQENKNEGKEQKQTGNIGCCNTEEDKKCSCAIELLSSWRGDGCINNIDSQSHEEAKF